MKSWWSFSIILENCVSPRWSPSLWNFQFLHQGRCLRVHQRHLNHVRRLTASHGKIPLENLRSPNDYWNDWKWLMHHRPNQDIHRYSRKYSCFPCPLSSPKTLRCCRPLFSDAPPCLSQIAMGRVWHGAMALTTTTTLCSFCCGPLSHAHTRDCVKTETHL